MEDLWSLNAGLLIRTNSPDNEEANANRRINCGFHLAVANTRVKHGFEQVIKFAEKSRISEHPCFYDVLCGKEGERRVGSEEWLCNGMKVRLLDRDRYPNGGTRGIRDVDAGSILQRFPQVMVLHNNSVKGMEAGWERLISHGFDMYNSALGLCSYPRYSKSAKVKNK